MWRGEGVYGEIFCAVTVSAAFYKNDMRHILETGLAYVPPGSQFARVVRQTMDWCASANNWHEPMRKVYETYARQYHWVHTFPNIAMVVIGLFFGGGDFAEALHFTALCGLDANCTAGQAAALMGVLLGAEKIPEKWKDPLQDKFEIYIRKFESLIISDIAKKTIKNNQNN